MDDRRCACGRGLPMLKEIQGRTTDFVVTAEGTVMHGLALIYILRDLPGLRSFKVVQHSRLKSEVLLVPEAGFDQAAAFAKITEGFKRRLGPAVEVELKVVDAIAPEKSGKFRYIVSHAN
jgi:phenylacetate-CoA ligase